MSAPAPTLTPGLLFAALLLTVQPEPAVRFAVRVPIDSWDGRPSVITLADTVTADPAEARRHLHSDGVLVSGLADVPIQDWEVVR